MEYCRNCPYQSFGFLSENDTICPFMYDEIECYNKTKGKIKEIEKYDTIRRNTRNNNKNAKNNKKARQMLKKNRRHERK